MSILKLYHYQPEELILKIVLVEVKLLKCFPHSWMSLYEDYTPIMMIDVYSWKKH